MFLRADAEGDEWPDLSDAALTRAASEWLAPALARKARSRDHGRGVRLGREPLLPWPLQRRLDAEAPTHFMAPTGSQVPIDYEAEGGPKIAIRVQELFGLDRHPAIAGGKVPFLIELLSPAHRPVQMSRDLPGFWRGSYAAVRAEIARPLPQNTSSARQPDRELKQHGAPSRVCVNKNTHYLKIHPSLSVDLRQP